MIDQNKVSKKATVETEHWVVMGSSKTQEVRREKVNHSLEHQNSSNNMIGKQNIFEEHHQDPPQEMRIDVWPKIHQTHGG